jgi:hypothetical protein
MRQEQTTEPLARSAGKRFWSDFCCHERWHTSPRSKACGGGAFHPLQQAFIDHDAYQYGYHERSPSCPSRLGWRVTLSKKHASP